MAELSCPPGLSHCGTQGCRGCGRIWLRGKPLWRGAVCPETRVCCSSWWAEYRQHCCLAHRTAWCAAAPSHTLHSRGSASSPGCYVNTSRVFLAATKRTSAHAKPSHRPAQEAPHHARVASLHGPGCLLDLQVLRASNTAPPASLLA